MTSGPCRETSYTAITLNPESNFTRREKNHSLFHLNTLTSPELHIRIWMSSRRSALMIIGTLMALETCLILGQVSHNSLFVFDEKPPDGYKWSGGRLTKRQVTSRPDHWGPELWTKLGRNAEQKERQKWSNEKRKLDNARRLRGFYFIDPEDKEFKETIRNARKKLETPMAPAMLCKTCKKSKKGETRSKTNDFKSKCACILEASESTRMRMEESLPNYLEDHIAGRGRQFTATLHFGTQIYSCASSHEDTRSKSSSG